MNFIEFTGPPNGLCCILEVRPLSDVEKISPASSSPPSPFAVSKNCIDFRKAGDENVAQLLPWSLVRWIVYLSVETQPTESLTKLIESSAVSIPIEKTFFQAVPPFVVRYIACSAPMVAAPAG